jgi:hypothetical protein
LLELFNMWMGKGRNPLVDAVGEYVADVRNNLGWVEELNEHSRHISQLYSSATPEDVEAALRLLAGLFPDIPLVALGTTAITAGALVENGGDPGIIGPALLDKLQRFADLAATYYERVSELAIADIEFITTLPKDAESDEIEGERTADAALEAHIQNHGWQQLTQRFGPTLYKEAPEVVLAHMAEQFYRLGLIAHLSRSKPLRSSARARIEMLEAVTRLDKVSFAYRSFLATMLHVLDDESLVVIHVGQRKGYLVRISGLADNFQLHTLLGGTLIGKPVDGWLIGSAPAAAAVDEFKDRMPGPEGGTLVTGPFNLFNWTALQLDGHLPEGHSNSEHWVWNEGWPAEIAAFEGQRVVLLGNPPYGRGWRAGRQFAGLVGELSVEGKLSATEVDAWLDRLAAAAR